MEADEEEEEEAQREEEAGDDDYDEKRYKSAVEHYARGASLDPGDISLLIKCGRANLRMNQYEECVRHCDEAVERGRELRSQPWLVGAGADVEGVSTAQARHPRLRLQAGDHRAAAVAG